ncbi:MAG: hypothetical protein KAS17_00615 [Victivallaceae bacterium]|nr:hypothetical protein [Victivallaceae bacterium]
MTVSLPIMKQAPKIDGHVSPAEWENASRLTGFHNIKTGRLTGQFQPTVYLARDDKNLYFAFVTRLKEPTTKKVKTRDGAVWADDSFELFLDPERSIKDYYHFIFGAGGAVYDTRCKTGYDSLWNSNVRYKTTEKKGLWSGEVSIPLKDLQSKSISAKTWGFNICRNYKSSGSEWTSLAYVGGKFHNPKLFGNLVFNNNAPSVQTEYQIGTASFGKVKMSYELKTTKNQKVVCNYSVLQDKKVIISKKKNLSLLSGKTTDIVIDKTLLPTGKPETYTVLVSMKDAHKVPVFHQKVSFILDRKFTMHAGYGYQQKAFAADFLYNTSASKGKVTVDIKVTDPAGKIVAEKKRQPLLELKQNSGRWSLPQILLKSKVEETGDYLLEAVIRDENNNVMDKATAKIPCKPPEWLGNKIGITDKVLPPYTPCEVKQRKGTYDVHTWGRRYVFASSPFLKEIESAKSQILTGPVRFIAVTDSGEELKWSKSIPKLQKSTPAEVQLHQELSGKETSLTINSLTEYDGFIKVDWTLKANKNIGLKRLVVEFPLNPQYAKMFYSYRCGIDGRSGKTESAVLEKNWASPFCPIVLIGDENLSLCWVAESDQNWSLSDSDKAIEIIKKADEVTLRLNLVTKQIKLKKDQKLDYAFGLQATPVRPVKKTCWDIRFVRCPPYGHEYKWMTRKVKGKPVLQHYSEKGAGRLLVSRLWDAFSYPLPLGHEMRFQKLVEACHRQNLKVMPYVVGFLLSEVAPESKYYRDDMITYPKMEYPLKTNRVPGLDGQMNHVVCPQSALWRDFCASSVDRFINEYDIDGIYLDSTVQLRCCKNRLHGCGYERPDGTIGGRYPVFATRQFMKRLYTTVKSRNPNAIVDLHIFNCLNIPGIAFADSYWVGEALTASRNKTDVLPLARFRMEFMGRNFGIPAELLYYILKDYDACAGLGLIHDVSTRSENEKDLAIQTVIWQIRDKFGCKAAKFLGYWENRDLVKVTPDNCYVSLWLHQDNGVLAVVNNLSSEETDIHVDLNLRKLGLPEKVHAEDVRHSKVINMEKGKFSLKLKPQNWTIVWIKK